MKVLVIGGTGFIGSHVVDDLVAAGHSVRTLSRNPDPWRQTTRTIPHFLGDFASKRILDAALKGVDAVCHLVSTTVPSTSNKDPQMDIRTNLLGTVNLIETMMDHGIQRIVYASSGGTVYGIPDRLPITEEAPTRPICSYGIVKVAVENYLQMFERLHGLKPVILRPSNPYGQRQGQSKLQGVIGAFARSIVKDNEISIWGDGSIVRDFIHINDLARLFRLTIEQGTTGIFNAGMGVGTSVNDVVALISKTTSKSPKINYLPARPFDVPSIILDISRTRRTFEWEPETCLETGIAQLCKNLYLSDR